MILKPRDKAREKIFTTKVIDNFDCMTAEKDHLIV